MLAVGPTPSGSSTGLFVISIFGGAPRMLRDQAGRAVVSPDGRQIAFVNGRGSSEVWLMGSAGEDPRPFIAASEGTQFVQLQWSPNSRRVAFLRLRSEGANPQLEIASRAVDQQNDEVVLSDPNLRSFCWTGDGRVIYSADERGSNSGESNLWTIAVDSRTGKPEGAPQRLTRWPGFAFSDLSVTADSKQLAFVRSGEEANIFVSDLAGKNAAEPQRLTSDQRHNVPTAWAREGGTIYFHSDRNGNWDILRQASGARTAEDFLLGPEQQLDARLVPDGSALLLWSYAAGQSSGKMRLVRVPITGGSQDGVLEASAGARFRCARTAARCVLSELSADRHQVVFSVFDPTKGRGSEIFRAPSDPYNEVLWDVAPDGNTLALIHVPGTADNEVQLRSLDGKTTQSIKVQGDIVNFTDVAWNADGQALVLCATAQRGSTLWLSDRSGHAREIVNTVHVLTSPVPSPDGKRVAYGITSQTSNAWLLTNF